MLPGGTPRPLPYASDPALEGVRSLPSGLQAWPWKPSILDGGAGRGSGLQPSSSSLCDLGKAPPLVHGCFYDPQGLQG